MWSTLLFDPGPVRTTPGVLARLAPLDEWGQAKAIIRLLVRHINR